MKTKEELEKEISDLDDRLFIINMVDHWQQEDREAYEELSKQKQELKKELEKIENEK